MKVFLSLTFLAAVAFAEPPLYRQQQQQQQQQQRYFFARQQEETTAASGPYQPSGWRPEGPAFNLPVRSQKQEQQQPQVENAYGAPQQPQESQQQYGPPQAPQQQYGAPQGPSPRQGLPTLTIQAFARQQQQSPQQYGAPQQQPQQQYGAPQQQPQQQYGAPQQQPQQQYGAPQQQQYRSPARQQQQPNQQYGASSPQEQYGAPQQQQPEQYRVPARQQQQQPQPDQYRTPARQQQQPNQQYGAPQPQQQYGAPEQQYGAPEYTTTEVPNATEIDEPVTDAGLTDSDSEPIGAANELEEDAELDEQPRQEQQRGEYYVALPDGRLQRVRYVSRQDIEAMRYSAKIRAENVEPLRGPIYAYSPLQKLEVAPGSLQVAVGAAPAAPPTLTVTASESKPQKLVQPKVDIKPLAQVQIQHDNPAQVVPLSSSFTTYTANYQVPAAEERYILAFP